MYLFVPRLITIKRNSFCSKRRVQKDFLFPSKGSPFEAKEIPLRQYLKENLFNSKKYFCEFDKGENIHKIAVELNLSRSN